MKILGYLLLVTSFLSCINHNDATNYREEVVAQQKNIVIKYAKGFNVKYWGDSLTEIITNSNSSNFTFTDSIFIVNKPLKIELSAKKINKRQELLALQSSTYLAYLDVLNQLKLVKGLSGVSYVNHTKYKKLIDSNKIIEISNAGEIQLESLLKVNPSLFLIFPFELETSSIYNTKGINTLLISEYLEKTPLARLEWIKLFGLLFNETAKANAYFDTIETKYLSQINKIDTLKTVFFNLPFNDTWNMPASNSITANLVKDAGLSYVYKSTGSDNISLSKEIVWDKGIKAKYWVIIAARPNDYSLSDLLNEEEIYKEFESVKQGNVIFCNTATTNYFTNGPTEPHLLLKSLLLAIKGEHTKELNYFKLLK